ncbi:MAG: hypothetical protein IJC98_03035 [Clostridia bacterium]|nr:hypothetical protein [Clostridia bacterium]
MNFRKRIISCMMALLLTFGMCGCGIEGASSGDHGLSAKDIFDLIGSLGKQAIEGLMDMDLSDLTDLMNEESQPEYSEELDGTQWQLYAVKNSDGIHQVFRQESGNAIQLLYREIVYIDFYGASDLASVRYQFTEDMFSLQTEMYTYQYFEHSKRASQPTYSETGKFEIYEDCGNDLWYVSMDFSSPGSFLDGSSADYDQYYDYEEYHYRTDDPDWPFTFGEEECWYATIIDDHMEIARYTVQNIDGKRTRADKPHTIWYLYERSGEVPAMPE